MPPEAAPAARELPLSIVLLDKIDSLALSLANLAGAEILTALGGMHSVRYKTLSKSADAALRDPVSEIDEQVENSF